MICTQLIEIEVVCNIKHYCGKLWRSSQPLPGLDRGEQQCSTGSRTLHWSAAATKQQNLDPCSRISLAVEYEMIRDPPPYPLPSHSSSLPILNLSKAFFRRVLHADFWGVSHRHSAPRCPCRFSITHVSIFRSIFKSSATVHSFLINLCCGGDVLQ